MRSNMSPPDLARDVADVSPPHPKRGPRLRAIQPMKALMDFRSLPFKLTAEDRRTVGNWRWSLATVYGAALLMLVLIVAAAPYTKTDNAKTDTASSRIDPGVSSAAIAE